jgi:AraC family transcriptional regulator of adaptative response/methylated-DNA-[protein]-cysteine methyltransferase
MMRMEDDMLEQQRWEAVSGRAAAADGAFVYAVRTTGVYCRPSCASRRPLRQNVEFFDLPEAAERAGYRACRRCRPQLVAAADPAIARVRQACAAIDAALEAEDGPPALAGLAELVGLSPFHLQRLFKRHLGISPKEYGDARRLARAKVMMREGESVSGAVYGAGYGSSSRLYERADAQLGMTPATYRKGGRGAAIFFATAPTPLGRLLAATTERGICAVSLGDDAASLEARLRAEYPEAAIVRDDARLAPALEAIVDALEHGSSRAASLPLDIRATAFQWRVWQELQRIPRGTTLTYTAVAEKLGMPRAARAVARACASNRAALVIPCHRVVREDGHLGGYRWGLERKERLLAEERTGGTPAARKKAG